MIEKISAYKSSDGKFFGSIEDVQRHELMLILEEGSREIPGKEPSRDIPLDVAISLIVKKRDQVVDVLTTGPKSKPKARAINGGTRTRKPRVQNQNAKGPEYVDDPKAAA